MFKIFPLSDNNFEPTHPQAGTKMIHLDVFVQTEKRTNPPPLGDEKYKIPVNVAIIGKNQPIPTRGRKYAVVPLSCRVILEPTHPQAGTKISKPYHIQTYAYEPTHPQAGTKILHL